MRTLSTLLVCVTLLLAAPGVFAADIVTYPSKSLSAIEQPLQGRLALGEVKIMPDSLALTALKGSDFYAPQDGTAANLTAPTLLFPVNGDFIFSARVTIPFQNNFDGAALMLYADDTHWAKLLVERSQPGMEGATSTVVNGLGDDAYHLFLKPGETVIFLKITRQGNMAVFYTSADGKAWTVARDFVLDTGAQTFAGFEAQSPLGEKVEAHFDHIRFEVRTPSDFWQGE
jgi:regulation of enolase protein 1 (concanavalin A-like superfamily)